MKITLLLLVSICVVYAARVKVDDAQQLKKEGEAVAAGELEEFKKPRSWNVPLKRDHKQILSLLNYIKKAQANNVEVVGQLTTMSEKMEKIVSEGVDEDATSQLHKLVTAFEANKRKGNLNLSLTVLDFSREWIDRRLPATDGILKSLLQRIREPIVEAMEAAKDLTEIVSEIRDLTGEGMNAANSEQIMDVIGEFGMAAGDATLINDTDEAVMLIEALANHAATAVDEPINSGVSCVCGDGTLAADPKWTRFIEATDSQGQTEKCVATLISDQHLLTAKDCIKGKKLKVYRGEYTVSEETPIREVMYANQWSDTNNVAVVKLEKPFCL